MIEAIFEFQPGTLTQLVSKLLELPVQLRPSHHSLGEDEQGKLIKDPEEFVNCLIERSPGPYLTGSHSSYNISIAALKPIICHARLDVELSMVWQLMLELASLKPVFGFACTQEEWYRRNRVTIQQGINKIESWVGRDTKKYLPGFYWLTLLSDEIVRLHSIPISAVDDIAQEHVFLDGGQHVFRFYQQPEDWSATSKVSQLCASLPGVFNVEKVTSQFQSAKNFLELSEMLRFWK